MTSLPPNHPQQTADNLTNRYTALQAALTLANERFEEAVQAGDIKETRALKNSLENALREFREEVQREYVTLDDGRPLLKHEYEGLEAFATNNKLRLEQVLTKVTITDGSVTELVFVGTGTPFLPSLNVITTLEGLSALRGLIKLDVRKNFGLTSLHGVPTDNLKVLNATFCRLAGDLSAISNATKLEKLWVWKNPGLTSLQGVPTKNLRELLAEQCGLTGDLSAIANAKELEKLSVGENLGLTSLNGVPTDKLKVLLAHRCGLAGDLSDITNATELEELSVGINPGLTSLHGVPTKKLKVLDAVECGLTGDLSAISNATKLETLCIGNNPGLTSLHGVPTRNLRILLADECGLAGDLSAIANATELEELNLSSNQINQAEAKKTIEKLKQHSLREINI